MFCLTFWFNTETLKQTIQEKKAEQVECNAKIADIQANLADAKGYRDRQLKEAKEHMEKMKAKSEKSRKEWEKREKEAETLKLEIEGLKEGIEKAREEIAGVEQHVEELQQKVTFSNMFLSKLKLTPLSMQHVAAKRFGEHKIGRIQRDERAQGANQATKRFDRIEAFGNEEGHVTQRQAVEAKR